MTEPTTTDGGTTAMFISAAAGEKNLFQQLLKNARKLLKAYKRTGDKSLLAIVDSLLQLASEEASTSESTTQKIHLTPGVPGVDEITIPWVQPPSDPLGPPVTVYGVPTEVVAYAAPPIITPYKQGTSDVKIIVGDDTTHTCGTTTPFVRDTTSDQDN